LRLVTCILLAINGIAFAGTTVSVGTVPNDVLALRLRNAPRRNEDRQARIRELFVEAGCAPEDVSERKVRHSHWSNVVCTIRGTGESEIVTGAHFDHVDVGDGVVDDWSGAAMLGALITSLKTQPRNHTFLFVAFANEEKGLVGSHDFADSMKKEERATIQAMVNIDCVGVGTTAVWPHRANRRLLQLAQNTATAVGLELDLVNVEKVGDSDSHSFDYHGIPVIDFHSIHPETLHLLHSKQDVFGAIDMAKYGESFRIISTYLGVLDQVLR